MWTYHRSGRTNRSPDWSYSVVSGIMEVMVISSKTNSGANYKPDMKDSSLPSQYDVTVTWSDGFNTNRAGSRRVTVNGSSS